MSFVRGVAIWRTIALLAAPALVAGMLLWQRQSPSSFGERAAEPPAVQTGQPAGVSPEEWEAARVEFEGLIDSTCQCSSEEMPAYWRLLKWSVRQSESQIDRNLFSRVSYNRLVNNPRVLRGMPAQIDLHICRIVSYPAPENSLGIEQLYEVWGWSDDSRGSLYVAVTPQLPAGMQTGESVCERATICGYFFKIQGYLAAGSASQLAAPLIIGRMKSWEPSVAVVAQMNELWFASAGILLAASFVWLLSRRPLVRYQTRERLAPSATAKLETWLELEGPVQPQVR